VPIRPQPSVESEPSKRLKVAHGIDTAGLALASTTKAFPTAAASIFADRPIPYCLRRPPAALDAALFSTDERASWESRNRVTREIPDLAIGWIGESSQAAEDIPC